MGVWAIISVVTMTAFALGFIYMVWAVARFPFVGKITKDKKAFSFLIAAALILLIFIPLSYCLSVVNAIVIFLSAMAFRMLFGLIGHIIRLIRKKPFKTYWQGYLSLILCVLYFIAGYIICHHVVLTEYNLTTDKDTGPLKVAMFADSHLGTTFDSEKFGEYMDDIMSHDPDMILIVGDFVDDSTKKSEMISACGELGRLNPKYGVWYVFGNHDRGYNRTGEDSFNGDELADELTRNNVHVLVDEAVLVDDRFYIIGREDDYRKDRMSAQELVTDLDPGKYTIVMDHQPTDYDNEAAAGMDLVLSGHTHGGQMLPVTYVGEWFGLNDRTYGYERRGGTDFIVTSGISDWELLFKTGTKSEYVIVNINRSE